MLNALYEKNYLNSEGRLGYVHIINSLINKICTYNKFIDVKMFSI